MQHPGLPQLAKSLVLAGFVAMLAAVAIGAFGAHALRARIDPGLLAAYHTGVEYHFYHALGLIALGLVAVQLPRSTWLAWAGWCLAAGIVLFSGSLYLLALTGTRAWGAVAPIGGTAFILGWACAAIAMLRPEGNS